MEEERRQLSQDVSMDDRERLKSISQLELRLKALEAERAKLRDAHYDTGWVEDYYNIHQNYCLSFLLWREIEWRQNREYTFYFL